MSKQHSWLWCFFGGQEEWDVKRKNLFILHVNGKFSFDSSLQQVQSLQTTRFSDTHIRNTILLQQVAQQDCKLFLLLIGSWDKTDPIISGFARQW